MKEFISKEDGSYIYVTDNYIFNFNHKMNRLENESMKELEERLKKEAIHFEERESLCEKKFKKQNNKIIRIYLMYLISITVFFSTLHNKENIQSIFKMSKEKQLVEKNIGKFHSINMKEIAIIKRLLGQSTYMDELIESQVLEILSQNGQSKEEYFYELMKSAIISNAFYSQEEKEILIKEKESQIKTFGRYYNFKTMIDSIDQVANTKTMKKYGTTTATFCRDRGNYGTIHYDPYWEEWEKTLNHESVHSETVNNNPAIYKEVTAAFLACEGYPKERALFTMLGRLGDEKVVISSLINGNVDDLWKSIKEKTNHSQDAKIDYLRYLCEKMPLYDLNESEEKLKIQSDIITYIDELYKEVYVINSDTDALMNVSENIFLGFNNDYENIDPLAVNGQYPVRIRINDTYQKDVVIPLTLGSNQLLTEEYLNTIIEYLSTNESRISNEYYLNLEFWIASYVGLENYSNLIQSESKTEFLKSITIQKKSDMGTHYETISFQRLKNIITAFDHKEYQDIFRIYINHWNEAALGEIDLQNVSFVIKGMAHLLNVPEEELINQLPDNLKPYINYVNNNLMGLDLRNITKSKARVLSDSNN